MSALLRYEVHGPAAASQTVILSSGLGGMGGYWRPQMAALTAQYRVVTYDQRGTGKNAEPLPAEYSIGAMADDVAAIIQDLGGRPCHFVGHALGGLVGLDLAIRYRKLLSSVVPVNAWAKVDSHTERCFDVRIDILKTSGPAAYVRAQPIFLHPAAWLSQHAEKLREEEAHGVAHFQGAETLLRRIGALRRFDVTAKLGQIETPTLVIGTRDDMLVPYTCSQALAAAIPSAMLSLFDTGGHASNVTDPEPFNQTLLAFLKV